MPRLPPYTASPSRTQPSLSLSLIRYRPRSSLRSVATGNEAYAKARHQEVLSKDGVSVPLSPGKPAQDDPDIDLVAAGTQVRALPRPLPQPLQQPLPPFLQPLLPLPRPVPQPLPSCCFPRSPSHR